MIHSEKKQSTQKLITQMIELVQKDILKSLTGPGVVAHACNPCTWKAETGGSQVQSQSQQFSKTLSNLMRPFFQIKNKTGLGRVAQR